MGSTTEARVAEGGRASSTVRRTESMGIDESITRRVGRAEKRLPVRQPRRARSTGMDRSNPAALTTLR